MVLVSSSTCPHGLTRDTCQICRVLEPTAVPGGRAPDRGRGRFGGNLAVVAVVAVVGFVVFGWVAAAFFAVLRIVELLAVALVAGWVGWKLGVQHGRRQR
jgi:hypothetical protein